MCVCVRERERERERKRGTNIIHRPYLALPTKVKININRT